MEFKIENYNELLTFIKREDVSASDAITVFGNAFNVTNIVFICAITREPNLIKEEVIRKIENYVTNYENGIINKIVLF